MKNLYLLIAVALTLSITSCSTVKPGSNSTISKERMQMDAYAMANIECDYNLLNYSLEEDRNNFSLQSEFKALKQDYAEFLNVINERYNKSTGLRPEFNDLVKSSKKKLQACKKLQEFEDIKAKKKIEKVKTDKK
jgi:phage tail tape-measure protein